MCSSEEDFQNNVKWTRCKYSKWEVVLGAPDRVNIPCLMHDTYFCELDVKMIKKLAQNPKRLISSF